MRDPRRIYLLTLVLLLAGSAWMFVNVSHGVDGDHTICIFKNLTSLPCPSCGTTRALALILNGQVADALEMNPMGIVTTLLFAICFSSVLRDSLLGRTDFLVLWNKSEQLLKKKYLYLPLTGLILINWCWSIAKGL